MSVVVNVHDELARRLEAEAASRSVSVEESAIAILDAAVSSANGDSQDWGSHNRRRLQLIRKSNRSELTEQEQAELDQLQSCLDERFDSFDAGLLGRLKEMKRDVARLAAEHSHE